MRALSVLACATLLCAGTACSGGNPNDDVAASTPATVPSAPTTVDAPSPDSLPQATTEPARPVFADGPLAEVCPQTLVVQLGGQASIEHGPLLRLLGDDAVVDTALQSVTGSLVRPDGTLESITLEVRFGGPATGFRSSVELLAEDSDISIVETGIVDVAAAAFEAAPVMAFASLTDTSHHMIMWDPQTYPSVSGVADLRDADVEVRHVTGERFIEFLVANGDLVASQLTDGFFGEPAAFVADEGISAQQGDALVDPFLYPSIDQWGRPIASELAAASGWDSYDDVLAVRASDLEALTPCLGRLVPIVQDALVAYAGSPAATNARLADWRAAFNPLTRATPERLDAGAAAAVELGVVANGPDGTVGGFDLERLDRFIAAADEALGIEPVPLDTLVTNDFVALDRSL